MDSYSVWGNKYSSVFAHSNPSYKGILIEVIKLTLDKKILWHRADHYKMIQEIEKAKEDVRFLEDQIYLARLNLSLLGKNRGYEYLSARGLNKQSVLKEEIRTLLSKRHTCRKKIRKAEARVKKSNRKALKNVKEFCLRYKEITFLLRKEKGKLVVDAFQAWSKKVTFSDEEIGEIILLDLALREPGFVVESEDDPDDYYLFSSWP